MFSKLFHRGFTYQRIQRLYSTRIVVSDEIRNALDTNKPLVALESTIITHGMPFPNNYNTAINVEATVRGTGAIPATIGVVDGIIKVGLTREEILRLAEKRDNSVKVSRRDLPLVVSKGLSGGTTVAGTMVIAHKVGIKVFATGGIGGVHCGAETSFDISADLRELGRTPVAVFSSGIKSILDIEKSLEYLETEGVTVATLADGYSRGQNDDEVDFPAFFSPQSGLRSPFTLHTLDEVANLILQHNQLELQHGLVIAVPFEPSKDSLVIEEAIKEALFEAQSQKIKGKHVTPFVLSKVNEKTGGISLKLNEKLIENNARVAGKVAVRVASGKAMTNRTVKFATRHTRPVVVGGTVVDINLSTNSDSLSFNGSTYPVSSKKSVGGVARNLASGLRLLGEDVYFITAIGNDPDGQFVLQQDNFISGPGLKKVNHLPTASMYVLLNKVGSTVLILGDSEIAQEINVEHIKSNAHVIAKAPLVMLDLNLQPSSLDLVCQICSESGVPVWFEPTDPNLCHLIAAIKPENRKCLVYTSPNLMELRGMALALECHKHLSDVKDAELSGLNLTDLLQHCEQVARGLLDKAFTHVFVTLGANGLLLVSKSANASSSVKYFAAPLIPQESIVSTSGAGDTFAAATACGLIRGKSIHESVETGLKAAELTIKSYKAISDDLRNLVV